MEIMNETSGEHLRSTPEYMRWYEENGFARCDGDRIQFLDPMTGEDLPSGEFPRCVLDDAMCGAGVEVLKSLASRGITVHAIFNYHRSEDKDFGPLIEKAGHVLDAADVVGLEWNIGADVTIPQSVDEIAWEFIAEDNAGMGSYIRATQRYVGLDRTVPCDIDYPIEGLRKRLDEVYNQSTITLEGEDAATEKIRQNIGYLAYMSVRNPMMLAAFGYGIGLHDVRQPLRDDSSVAIIVGSAHEVAMTERLRAINIEPQIHTILAGHEDTAFTNSTLHGSVPFKHLEAAIR